MLNFRVDNQDEMVATLSEACMRAQLDRLSTEDGIRASLLALDMADHFEQIPEPGNAEGAQILRDIGVGLAWLMKSRRLLAVIPQVRKDEARAKLANAVRQRSTAKVRTSSEVWAAMTPEEEQAERVQRFHVDQSRMQGLMLPLTPLMELERAEAERREAARERADAAEQARSVAYFEELNRPTGGGGPILTAEEQAIYDRSLGELDAARRGVPLGEPY